MTIQFHQFLKWVMLFTPSLIVSYVIAGVVSFIVSKYYDTSQLVDFIIEGCAPGLMLSFLIKQFSDMNDRSMSTPWFVVNILCMGAGVLLMSWVQQFVEQQSLSIGIVFLSIGLVGVVIGGLQWLLLRRNENLAGWWIPAMAISWTAVWSLIYSVAFILSEV